MKLILLFIYILLSGAQWLAAQESQIDFSMQLPSEIYYQEHIASPNPFSTRALLSDDDLDPGGSTTGQGGFVGAPVSDDAWPLFFSGMFYTLFNIYRKKEKEN